MSRIIAIAAVLTLAACAPPGPPIEITGQPVTLAQAELPQLKVGDRFEGTTNDEPWNYEVTMIEQDGVIHFAGDDGRTWQQASADFLVPVPGWQNDPVHGTGQHDGIQPGQKTGLWPLEAGKSVTFSQKGSSDKHPNGWSNEWTCTVLDPAQITVADVTHDTFPIECNRADEKRTRIRYYSPKMRRVVYDKNCHKTNGCQVYTITQHVRVAS